MFLRYDFSRKIYYKIIINPKILKDKSNRNRIGTKMCKYVYLKSFQCMWFGALVFAFFGIHSHKRFIVIYSWTVHSIYHI